MNNKKIVILGFGLEGKSTLNYLEKHFDNIDITIMDNNYQNIETKYNKMDINLDILNDYDIIFKSPGISFKGINISSFENKITSQVEYFLENKKGIVIGITGTKGKSTTTSLIYEILKSAGKKCFLLGNIGKPILDVLDDIDDNSISIIELSSHQLEYVNEKVDISAILNFYPEHLDHYNSLEDYYLAKLNIVKYQNENDYFLYTSDNKDLMDHINKMDIKAKKINITDNKEDNSYAYFDGDYIYVDGKKVFNINEDINLLGHHNLKNIAFALSICNILNIDYDIAIKAIKNFKGLAHRLEKVGTKNGIIYYNDSIATIPDAAENAVLTLKNVGTIIIGGMDRKIPYDEFISFLDSSNIDNIICLPDTGYLIYDKIKNKNKIKVNDVAAAVELADKITEKGKICLLSPAAPSYGFYKNFEDRGNAFKDAVNSL